MQEKGISKTKLLHQLKKRLKKDHSFRSGRIIGSMCTAPHPLAEKIFYSYIEKNAGDPGLCPQTISLESELIKEIGSLLGMPEAYGFLVSGGTEANILALWVAKKNSDPLKNEILISEDCHFSFDKAASLLDLKLIKIPVSRNGSLKIEELKKRISAKTLALVGIAGTTPLGAIDPIPVMSEIAGRYKLYLHVDAAFGGFVIPFARRLGRQIPNFDFSLPNVSSICLDPHKMGMAVIPAGGILFRQQSLAEKIRVEVPYLSGGESALPTIIGTRPGASIVATWALFKYLGQQGYLKVVKHCLSLTDYLVEEINRLPGYKIVTPPLLNIIGIAYEKFSSHELANYLRKAGWAVSAFQNHLRLVIMPHLTLRALKNFITALKKLN